MEKSEKEIAKENYEQALEALNRLLYGNGKRGVSIKEVLLLFTKYKISGNDRIKLLKESALKYL